MKTSQYPSRLFMFLFTVSIIIGLFTTTSCSSDQNDHVETVQTKEQRLDQFSGQIINDPIFLQFLDAKTDLILEFALILDSKPVVLQNEIEQYVLNIKESNSALTYTDFIEKLEPSVLEKNALTSKFSEYHCKALALNNVFMDNKLNEDDINEINNIITASPRYLSILETNINEDRGLEILQKDRRTKKCNRRFALCITASSAYSIILSGGCVLSILQGPVVAAGCVLFDIYSSSSAFRRCTNSYYRCLGTGINNPLEQ